MAVYRPARLLLQPDWWERLASADDSLWVTLRPGGDAPGAAVHGALRVQDGVLLASADGPFAAALEPCPSTRARRLLVTCSQQAHAAAALSAHFVAPQAAFRDLHAGRAVNCVDVSPGQLAVSAGADAGLRVWQTADGATRRNLQGHAGDIYTCRLFPSGVVVLAAGQDLRVRIWDAVTTQCAATLLGHTRAVVDTCIVERGRNVVSVSKDGTAVLWDVGHQAVLRRFEPGVEELTCGTLCDWAGEAEGRAGSNDREVGTEGKLLVVGSTSGQVVATPLCGGDAASDTLLRANVADGAPPAPVASVACVAHTVIAACEQGLIVAWDLRMPRPSPLGALHDPSRATWTHVLPLPNGRLALSSAEGSVVVVAMATLLSPPSATEQPVFTELSGPDCDPVYWLAADEHNLYAASRDGLVRKYSLASLL